MNRKSVIFAGGGTGGHLYPEIAVAQRLQQQIEVECYFLCSNRPLDTEILSKAEYAFTGLSVQPIPSRPWRWPSFLHHYRRSVNEAVKMIRFKQAGCVIATGGFVSGPVVSAARKCGVHTILINLDAVPGKANRWLSTKVNRLLSVYDCDELPLDAAKIELPIRDSAIFNGDRQKAMANLGLEPISTSKNLVITGASQGARSINLMMEKLTSQSGFIQAMQGWRIIHLCGRGQMGNLETKYEQAGLEAKVIEFHDQMAEIWGLADLVISRGGAGSVAEMVANRCPAIILPYPYHKDQHQKKNAEPYAEAGGMLIIEDLIDADRNAKQMEPILCELLQNNDKWKKMKRVMVDWPYQNGAEQVVSMTRLILGM